jgi:polyphosphate kinase
MKRNLENRVEVLAPVEAPRLRNDVRVMLETLWNDRRSAWDMRPDGTYVQRQPEPEGVCRGCQEALIELAEKRSKGATRLKKRRSSGTIGGRNLV